MGLRDLVTGRTACVATGSSSSSSNPLSSLADAFLGHSPKSEVTNGLSASAVFLKASFDLLKGVPLSTVPGDDNEFELDQGCIRSMKGTDFVNGHHGDACGGNFQTSILSVPGLGDIEPQFRESEQIDSATSMNYIPKLDGPPEMDALLPLHQSPYQPYNVWPHQSKEHLQGLVNRSMDYIDVSYDNEMRRPRMLQHPQMDDFWNQLPTIHYERPISSTEVLRRAFGQQHISTSWRSEFEQGIDRRVVNNDELSGGLVSYGKQDGANSWFSEFKLAQFGDICGTEITNMVVLAQPSTLEQVSAHDDHPKFQGIDRQVMSDDEFSGGWLSLLGIALSHLGGFSQPRFWDEPIKWHEQVIGHRVWIKVVGLQQHSGLPFLAEATRKSLFDALQDAAMLAVITMRQHFPCEFRGTPFTVLPMVPGQRSKLDYPAIGTAAVSATFMGINYDDVATLQRERFTSFQRERWESCETSEEYLLRKTQSVVAEIERMIELRSTLETKPKLNPKMEANFILRDCGWSVLVSNKVQLQVEPSHREEIPPAAASSPAVPARARL